MSAYGGRAVEAAAWPEPPLIARGGPCGTAIWAPIYPSNRPKVSEMKYDRELISNGNPMEAVVGFSRAVRVGPYISIGGTAPVGPDGKTVGVGDVAAQTQQCIEIIKAALEQAGSGLHDVVRTRIILTDIENWKAAIDVRKEYFRDVRPVDTIMAINRFVNPEWLIEIEADAVISNWGY